VIGSIFFILEKKYNVIQNKFLFHTSKNGAKKQHIRIYMFIYTNNGTIMDLMLFRRKNMHLKIQPNRTPYYLIKLITVKYGFINKIKLNFHTIVVFY